MASLTGRLYSDPTARISDTYIFLSSFGMVNFSYGYINRHSSDNLSTKGFSSLQDIFHLRQIQYPINVTVFHTLECNNLDIIPLRKFHSLPLLGENAPQEDQARKKLLGEGKPGEYCLISLDISNVFGMPFNATLSRRQAGNVAVFFSSPYSS